MEVKRTCFELGKKPTHRPRQGQDDRNNETSSQEARTHEFRTNSNKERTQPRVSEVTGKNSAALKKWSPLAVSRRKVRPRPAPPGLPEVVGPADHSGLPADTGLRRSCCAFFEMAGCVLENLLFESACKLKA